MYKAILETYRRRTIQKKYNDKHDITPQIAISNIKNLQAAKEDDIDIFTKKENEKKKKLKKITKKEKEIILRNLEEQLKIAIENWELEKATELRDQIKEIREN